MSLHSEYLLQIQESEIKKVWLGMYAHIVQEIHEWQQQQHKAGLVHVLLQFIEAVSFFNFYCSVPCVEYL